MVTMAVYPQGKWDAAKQFVETKLQPFDTSDLELTLDHSMKRREFVDGTSQPPKKRARKDRRWFVRAKVGDCVKYPFEVHAPVGSEQIDRLAAKLLEMPKPFEYVYDKETCDDDQELMVWSAGWFLWWYLRKTKKVGGRAAKTDAARNAFEWLRQFRKERGKLGDQPKRYRKRGSLLGEGIIGFVIDEERR